MNALTGGPNHLDLSAAEETDSIQVESTQLLFSEHAQMEDHCIEEQNDRRYILDPSLSLEKDLVLALQSSLDQECHHRVGPTLTFPHAYC